MRTGLEDVYWGWQHTAKTFLALLSAQERRPNAKYFACLHDDVYVHLPRLLEILSEPYQEGLYLGNAYKGHDFAGHTQQDVVDYEAFYGHKKMPVIMKGGLWVVDHTLLSWLSYATQAAAVLPWRLWPSDDDSVGLQLCA